jgi:NTP pyrophosphatase (non-canonical NTP hydrolase)
MNIKEFVKEVHENAVAHGWWEGGTENRNVGEIIALIHSEISEGFEAALAGNPQSEKIPEFTAEEEELADVIIRICDFSGAMEMEIDIDDISSKAFKIFQTDEDDYLYMHLYASRALECFRKNKDEEGYINLFVIVFIANSYAKSEGFLIEKALYAKHEYNKCRPYKHGKAF